MACPVFGGTLASADESAILGRRGIIQVVKLQDAVAVIADRYYRAKAALEKLPIRWDTGPAAATDSAQFKKLYLAALDRKGAVARHDGNVDAAMPAGRQGGRGDLRRADHHPRPDGAAQRHGACAGRPASTCGSAPRTPIWRCNSPPRRPG